MLQPAVYLALICLGALNDFAHGGGNPPTPAPIQTGDMGCIMDVDTGIMTASMNIEKKTSNVTRAFFVNPDWDEYTDNGCMWSGTGEDDDPFVVTVRIDLNSEAPPDGSAYCGHTLVDVETYEWRVYVETTSGYSVYGDVVFHFLCSALPNRLSTNVTVSMSPIFQVPTQNGVAEFGFYTPNNNLNVLNSLSLNIGDDFQLSLAFTPDNPQGNELGTWGAYCSELYVTPTPDREYRRFDLIDEYGCPNTHPFLQLHQEFIGTWPETNTVFRSRSGNIEAARFDRSNVYLTDDSNMLYFVCKVALCWRPRDPMCINRCGALTSRRKRSVMPRYTVMANITIIDPQETKPDNSQNYMIPILASTGGFMLLLLVVLAVAFACYRGMSSRRYHNHRDSSTTSDVSDRKPYWSSGKSSLSDKRSHTYSNYPLKY